MTHSESMTLKALVDHFQPTSILAVGPAAEEFLSDYLTARPDTRLETMSGEALLAGQKTLGTYDLAFVSHTLEHLDKTTAGHLIASLRDLHARRLLLLVPMGKDWPEHTSHWSMNDLLAFGLVHVSDYVHDDRPVHVYAYDINTYKFTPDWLSSRYWAHPELFNKYWW